MHLHDPDNHNGVITHLEPDILECEVKWALGSITSGNDRIPAELFQTLKDDALVLHSICQQIWKTEQWPQDEKRSVFSLIPKKGNAKEYSNYHTIVLIFYNSKVMLKFLQARFQQYMNQNFHMYKLDLERQRNQRSNDQHLLDHRESKRILRKHVTSLTMVKPVTVWITRKCKKFLKRY